MKYIAEIQAHLTQVKGNIPLHRAESRRVYSFSKYPFVDQLAIWDEVWRMNDDFYSRLHAYFFLERHLKKEEELRLMWPVIVQWQNQINDWGLCDALAKIYTRILELDAFGGEVYWKLTAWNCDDNPWKRRQSVVSLLYYSSTKKKYLTFEQIIVLITPLLSDKEYYVQKAVGWTLRELHNVYPEQTLVYLQQYAKSIGSGAFTTAMEKMDAETILTLREGRK